MVLHHKRITRLHSRGMLGDAEIRTASVFKYLHTQKFFILKLNESLGAAVAQIVLHFDIKAAGPSRGSNTSCLSVKQIYGFNQASGLRRPNIQPWKERSTYRESSETQHQGPVGAAL